MAGRQGEERERGGGGEQERGRGRREQGAGEEAGLGFGAREGLFAKVTRGNSIGDFFFFTLN